MFSPLLIVLYILPATAGATKALYRSLIEVSLWKVVWATLAALLWSFALSQINKPEAEVNFFTVIVLNLMLAASVLMTSLIVNALAGAGISSVASSMTGIATAAAVVAPAKMVGGPFDLTVGKGKAWVGNKFAESSQASANGQRRRQAPSKNAVTQNAAGSARFDQNPPQWHSEVPPPSEPPPWLRRQRQAKVATARATI